MLIQVEKDLPDMKHIKAVAGYILILSLCLVCAHPAHAETRRIALIHSFEPGYPPAAKALELLQKEFSLLGLDCDVREYYLSKVPMHKGCNPEDVTKAILYAVEQTGETGQAIPVSGGQVMLS